jgi:cyclohexadienyl dehydratase
MGGIMLQPHEAYRLRLLNRAALCLTLALASCVRAPLRVGSSGDYPPFSERTADGAWRGFDIEVARAWAHDRGRRLELVQVRWPDLGPALGRGEFDVAMSGVTVRLDRLLEGRFTGPVARTQAVLAAPHGTPPPRVAVNRGGHLERVARAAFPEARLVLVDDNRLAEALAAGVADGVVTDSLELPALAIPDLAVVRTLSDDRKAYFLRADAGALAADLDAWLALRERDGWLPALRRHVLGPGSDPSPQPAAVARLTDLIGRRLMLMPAVASAKRAAGLPVLDARREAEVEASAVARAEDAGIEPEPYRALARAQIAAARAVQEHVRPAPPTAPLAAIRAAIDRIDAALLPALIDALPVTTPPDVLVAAIRRDAGLAALSTAAARPIAEALRALAPVPGQRTDPSLPGRPVSAKLQLREDAPMAKATWNGTVLAESDRCEVVEGNHYFPPEAVRREYLRDSATHTTCGWKGVASYYDVVIDGKTNRDAAWFYPEPKDAARSIAGYVAFWRGVQVEP